MPSLFVEATLSLLNNIVTTDANQLVTDVWAYLWTLSSNL